VSKAFVNLLLFIWLICAMAIGTAVVGGMVVALVF
jgi:hypothetical protein